MDLEFKAQNVDIVGSTRNWGSSCVEIKATSIDENEVLEHFLVRDVINCFGENELLDEIGKAEAVAHFGITVAE